MKKLTLIFALVALLATPVLAGPPAQSGSRTSSVQLRQKLNELKKQKSEAMSTHVLEAELMKDVKRGSQPPGNETDSRLATRNPK